MHVASPIRKSPSPFSTSARSFPSAIVLVTDHRSTKMHNTQVRDERPRCNDIEQACHSIGVCGRVPTTGIMTGQSPQDVVLCMARSLAQLTVLMHQGRLRSGKKNTLDENLEKLSAQGAYVCWAFADTRQCERL